MVPQSDCVIAVPASSTACKTEQSRFAATVSKVEPHNDAAVVLELDVDATAPVFLAGQYVNIDVPGSGQHRSYSFSSAPGQSKISFLIKRIPGGVMSTWLESAQPGNKVELTGPLGSFYLRAVERPLLFLAGGTGLAPFLSMLEVLARADSQQKVHLIYGVTRDLDLVQVDAIEAYVAKLPNFTYTTVVADADSTHPRKGWVTQHMRGRGLERWRRGRVPLRAATDGRCSAQVFRRQRREAQQLPLREVHSQRSTEDRMSTQRFAGKVMVVTGAAQGIGRGGGAACGRRRRQGAVRGPRRLRLRSCRRSERRRTRQGSLPTSRLTKARRRRWRLQCASLAASTYWSMVSAARFACVRSPSSNLQQIDAEIRRSLMPTLYACHAVLPHLLKRGSGTIVNISSNATRGIRRVPYSAAKGGVNAMTQSLAMEYAEHNIRVVATAPGGTDAPPRRVPRNTAGDSEQEKVWMGDAVKQVTESTFLKRYGSIDEQVAPILFLASDEAGYITGTVLPVAGGDTG